MITEDQVIGDLEVIVRSMPEDFVYTPPTQSSICVYLHEEKPSCIIGHYLLIKELILNN